MTVSLSLCSFVWLPIASVKDQNFPQRDFSVTSATLLRLSECKQEIFCFLAFIESRSCLPLYLWIFSATATTPRRHHDDTTTTPQRALPHLSAITVRSKTLEFRETAQRNYTATGQANTCATRSLPQSRYQRKSKPRLIIPPTRSLIYPSAL